MIRCKHCNGEHPDDYKFCPVTGKELEQPLKACSNPDCDNFEKSVLPVEARFCPKCGVSIINDNHKQREMVGNTIVESFFPMYGVILGKTKLGDVEERYVHAGEKMTIYSPYN